jgi:hypothetical protein
MRTVYFDCGGLPRPTAATIDQIARLKLAARRRGCELELRNANSDLAELICFIGLGGVLGVEPEGQAEQREQPCCIEEEGELDDPSLL